MGTPEYMAPEQASGNAVDHRADLYAVGVILWRMLTDVPLFRRKSALGLLHAKIKEDPPRVSAVPGKAGRVYFERVLQRALARDPARRYQSAEAFAADIATILADTDDLSAAPRRRWQAALAGWARCSQLTQRLYAVWCQLSSRTRRAVGLTTLLTVPLILLFFLRFRRSTPCRQTGASAPISDSSGQRHGVDAPRTASQSYLGH